VQRQVTNFLKRHVRPSGGYVALGGQDIMGIQAHELRQHIIVVDRPSAIEMTIREFLQLSGDGASSNRILKILGIVGLESTMGRLEDGLDTRIAPTGWPLTISESMQLKLAAALIARPQVMVLGKLLDTVPGDILKRSMDMLQRDCGATIVYFSNRRRDLGFDTYLHLDFGLQRLFASFDELCQQADGEPCEASPELGATSKTELLPAG
jgi:putative ABC transport system ATP-binding protein